VQPAKKAPGVKNSRQAADQECHQNGLSKAEFGLPIGCSQLMGGII
jgi:hypothetical protein